jgi:2-haloalkanoic acid dehalogenase type II
MTPAGDLKASIKVCMFDQYGTIVDMQSGLTEAAKPYLQAKGWKGNPNSFVTWWRRTHFENSMIDALLGREHTPYREIGHRSVALVLERAGIDYTMDEVRNLVAQIETLRPFPEVPEALARLQARYQLAVLSNGDPDMLEAAKQYHRIPFDRVISVAVANALSRTSRPIAKRPRSWVCAWRRCCSSPTMPSTASAPNRPACAPPSSIAGGARSASPRISPIYWWRIWGNSRM